MEAPQIIIIVFMSLGLFNHASKHGKLMEPPFDKYHIGNPIFRHLIWALILWWGGFWG